MIVATEHVTSFRTDFRFARKKVLALSGLCWIGFAVMIWLVMTGGTESFDQAGLLVWRQGTELAPTGPPWLLEAVRDLTALGGVLVRNLIAIGAIAALLFLKLKREAAMLAFTIAGGWILNSVAKLIFARPRPETVPHLMDAAGASFPSGHSFNSATVFIAIALVFAAISPRRRVRTALIGIAIFLSMAVAWSRVLLGVHFPSDVIAGWLGGAGWAFLAYAVSGRTA